MEQDLNLSDDQVLPAPENVQEEAEPIKEVEKPAEDVGVEDVEMAEGEGKTSAPVESEIKMELEAEGEKRAVPEDVPGNGGNEDVAVTEAEGEALQKTEPEAVVLPKVEPKVEVLSKAEPEVAEILPTNEEEPKLEALPVPEPIPEVIPKPEPDVEALPKDESESMEKLTEESGSILKSEEPMDVDKPSEVVPKKEEVQLKEESEEMEQGAPAAPQVEEDSASQAQAPEKEGEEVKGGRFSPQPGPSTAPDLPFPAPGPPRTNGQTMAAPGARRVGATPQSHDLATLATAALTCKQRPPGAPPRPREPVWCDVGVIKGTTCQVTYYHAPPAHHDPEHPHITSDHLPDLSNCLKLELEPGTAYKFRVCAVNSCGRGPWSEVSAFKTCLPGYPGAPSSIKISKSGEGAHLSWEPPSNPAGNIIEYSVCLAVRNAGSQASSSDQKGQQLAFVRVYSGPHNQTVVPNSSLGAAHIDTSSKPAIIFRIAAKNEKGFGPATQVRWLQDVLASPATPHMLRPFAPKNSHSPNPPPHPTKRVKIEDV